MKPQNNAQDRMVRMTDQEFTELTTFVKSKYGIDLTKKRVLIESRLSHELHQRGIDRKSTRLNSSHS